MSAQCGCRLGFVCSYHGGVDIGTVTHSPDFKSERPNPAKRGFERAFGLAMGNLSEVELRHKLEDTAAQVDQLRAKLAEAEAAHERAVEFYAEELERRTGQLLKERSEWLAVRKHAARWKALAKKLKFRLAVSYPAEERDVIKAERDRVEDERDALRAEVDALRASRNGLQSGAIQLRADNDALRTALRKYGHHTHNYEDGPQCGATRGLDCTCGLDAALGGKDD